MLKTISVKDLRLGMYLHQLSGSWLENPFWRTRFLLAEQRDLERLRESGIGEIVIDTDRGLDVAIPVAEEAPPAVEEALAEQATPASVTAAPAAAAPAEIAGVSREYVQALALCRRSIVPMQALFKEARLGHAISPEACLPLVEEIVDSVLSNPVTLISIARLKTIDHYTYMHAIATSALMVALARQLGLPPDQIRDAGLAGLLMDSGKSRVPQELLAKPGRLSELEMQQMRAHALRGHELLLEGGLATATVLDAALHHHERIDGSGYPDRLSGDRISLFARMGAVCDVYDAVTSRRAYKAPWDPGEAMRHMAQSKGQFDQRIFQSFVKAVGIYPVGSLVRLKSERLAIVIGPGTGTLLEPRVRVFYSVEERHAIEPFELDLADPRAGDKVSGVESPDAWRFNGLDRLWMRGA